MKEIKLISLELRNFKNQEHLKIDFNGRDTNVYGDNGTGKTTVYDSFTWLLFSKSSKGDGDKRFEVKPLNIKGDVRNHDAITEVEAVLSVSGEVISFRRNLREKWETKRGCGEPVYTGNVNEFFVDGVPVKNNVFTSKVSELVDEETFRVLTNVSHFADGISWQERRAVLFDIAGVKDDREIMATRDDFKPILEGMGRLSLDDYKKKLLSEKRGHVGAKNEIPARIDEHQRTIAELEGVDYEAARTELARLTARREGLEGEILSIEHDTARDHKMIALREAKVELSSLEGENRAYRASQTAGAVDIAKLRGQLAQLKSYVKTEQDTIELLSRNVSSLDRRISESRERWISVNRESFTGGICPTCGQALPADQRKSAEDSFESKKKDRLREIEQAANDLKEAKKTTEGRIDDCRNSIASLEKEIREKEAEISAAEANVVEVKDMDGYAERRVAVLDRISALERELAEIAESNLEAKGKLVYEVQGIKRDEEAQRSILAKEGMLVSLRERIEELREDARNAARCLESVEGMLFLIDEYARYKTRFVEDSVNGLFRVARFRLFREQANGGVEDRCDVVYNGVPYISLNNGAKINVGVDIINTLSRAYGVTVPLFVDNAESVTRLEGSDAQVIRLVVSEFDKELRVV